MQDRRHPSKPDIPNHGGRVLDLKVHGEEDELSSGSNSQADADDEKGISESAISTQAAAWTGVETQEASSTLPINALTTDIDVGPRRSNGIPSAINRPSSLQDANPTQAVECNHTTDPQKVMPLPKAPQTCCGGCSFM